MKLSIDGTSLDSMIQMIDYVPVAPIYGTSYQPINKMCMVSQDMWYYNKFIYFNCELSSAEISYLNLYNNTTFTKKIYDNINKLMSYGTATSSLYLDPVYGLNRNNIKITIKKFDASNIMVSINDYLIGTFPNAYIKDINFYGNK
jgi:hypothetical protein